MKEKLSHPPTYLFGGVAELLGVRHLIPINKAGLDHFPHAFVLQQGPHLAFHGLGQQLDDTHLHHLVPVVCSGKSE